VYRYFGILFGHLKASIALLSVTGLTAGGHGAVWLGASNPQATRWVQAGIETTAGDPGYYLYIEIGRDKGRNDSLWRWPTTQQHVAHVRLFHQGTYWRVLIDGHESHRVWLPHGLSIAALEDMAPGRIRSLAVINDKTVRGY